jgi:hypothetical protein
MNKLALLAGLGLLTLTTAASGAEPWQDAIATGLGKPGTAMSGGVYRVGFPRSDLKVTVDGVQLKPSFALGSWLGFVRHGKGDEVMLMGDLVLTDEEINPVMKRLVEGGIEITALHNHLLRNTPHTMYMHVAGRGEPTKLAATLRDALGASRTPFGGATAGAAPQTPGSAAPASAGEGPVPAKATAPDQTLDLDTAAIDLALGRKGKVNGGVYAVSVPRAETPKDHGMMVPEAMGSANAINFQPTGGGKAAITGDFVLTADEVNPVIRALRANDIEVTAVHNHMLDDEPRLFFMHFWANDDAAKLAKGLRQALDNVKVAKG